MWKSLAAAVLAATLIAPVRASALETNDLLGLVAMPLAVAAVSEISDVPINDLMDVVTLLNDAQVPPAQFIEVVRYVPVALVVEPGDAPGFVEFLRTQERQGLTGLPLVTSIERQYTVYGLRDIHLDAPQPRIIEVVENRETFVPHAVRMHLSEYHSHPHGGPPGQLKKELGLQTGAEVVHGSRPAARVVDRVTEDRHDGRDDDRDRTVVKQKKAPHVEKEKHVAVARSHKEKGGHAAKAHGNGKGNGKGHGHGNGGKGKGKG